MENGYFDAVSRHPIDQSNSKWPFDPTYVEQNNHNCKHVHDERKSETKWNEF